MMAPLMFIKGLWDALTDFVALIFIRFTDGWVGDLSLPRSILEQDAIGSITMAVIAGLATLAIFWWMGESETDPDETVT